MGPTFSVTSMRPSGRNASRQGSSNVLTVVMVKGRLASGFCSPTLTWAQAATDTRVKSNGAFANFIVISLLASRAPDLERFGALSLIVHYHWGVPNKCTMKASGARKRQAVPWRAFYE